jgi:hypothetical protein
MMILAMCYDMITYFDKQKKKRKTSGNGETSVQNNRSRGANVATTAPM